MKSDQKQQSRTIHNDDKIKLPTRLCSTLNTKAKSTKIGSKETESNRVSIADDNDWYSQLYQIDIVY